jgi:hypothetical protein
MSNTGALTSNRPSPGLEDQPVRDGCRTFLIVVRILRAEGGAELWRYYVYFTIIILPTYDVFSGTKYIFLSQLANTATSSPADDVHHYVIFQKLLDSIFKNFRYSYASGKFEHAELLLLSLDGRGCVWLL